METARLAERIVQLQEVAEEIREIVPTASIETPDTLGEVYAVLNGPGEAQGSFIEVLADGEADAAGLSGMGGGELTTEELQMWLQDNLDTLHTVVDQHSHVFTQLKSSAVAYEHRLRHTPSTWPVTGRITSEYGAAAPSHYRSDSNPHWHRHRCSHWNARSEHRRRPSRPCWT